MRSQGGDFMVLGILIGAVVGFCIGILFYRQNKKKSEAAIQDLKDMIENLKKK